MTGRKQRVLLSWSSGKDSAWCLQRLRRDRNVEVVGLMTTFEEPADRVAMHAVRRQLVERQAAAAGLPLLPVSLPWPCPNDVYEQKMAAALQRARQRIGIDGIAFGDLFLEDVRAYRERQFGAFAIELHFPLWQQATDRLAREMVAAGLQAYVTCVDSRQCPREFAGRRFDEDFLRELPDSVDPCGERGEFHTFVFGGPMFDRTVNVTLGSRFARDGFELADLLPGSAG